MNGDVLLWFSHVSVHKVAKNQPFELNFEHLNFLQKP